MGLKAWRQRQLDRADRMTAWADATDAKLAADKAERKAERAREDVREQQAQRDQQLELFRSTAASLGFDHDEVAERAAAVGIGLPRLWKPSGRLIMGAALLNAFSLGGSSARDLDTSGSRYRMWVARVVKEEQARGIDLPYPRR